MLRNSNSDGSSPHENGGEIRGEMHGQNHIFRRPTPRRDIEELSPRGWTSIYRTDSHRNQRKPCMTILRTGAQCSSGSSRHSCHRDISVVKLHLQKERQVIEMIIGGVPANEPHKARETNK